VKKLALSSAVRPLADYIADLRDETVVLTEGDRAVAALAARLVEGRAVDCGRLEVARWLETLTAVLLNVNRHYRTNAGVRITGL